MPKGKGTCLSCLLSILFFGGELTSSFSFMTPHTAAVVYTMIWNLFDFPSGVVKFGLESGAKIDAYDHENDFMLRVAPKVSPRDPGLNEYSVPMPMEA